MQSGELLSIIAHAHDLSLQELLSISPTTPQELLKMLKEFRDLKWIKLEGIANLDELTPLFAKAEICGTVLDKRNAAIHSMNSERPNVKITISSRGFSRALNF